MTFRFFINDILKAFKQVFDDKDLQSTQVMYISTIVFNRLNKLSHDKIRTGLHVTQFYPVPVQIDTALKDRRYIELPAKIFDLDNDKAVRYITYNQESCSCCDGPVWAQTEFEPTTVAKAKNLYRSDYSKPKPANPYFYRVGNRLYLLGIECISVKDVEIALFTALDPQNICSLDEEIPLPDHLFQTAKVEVMNMVSVMFGVPQERTNEGSDTTTEQPQTPPQSAPPQSDQQIQSQTETQQQQQ